MNQVESDILIIGGASAGLSAALYASRQGLKTLLITKDIGGQALLTDSIENYPSFEHIGGFELMSKFEKQARSFGTEFIYEEVTSIEINTEEKSRKFIVNSSSGKAHSTLALILAFGKTPRDLNAPGEREFKGKGVSYCAVCDGPLFKQKKVAIVGLGDPALDAALLLKEVASEVHIVQPTNRPVGSDEIIRILQDEGNVSFIPNSKVSRINGTLKVESLTLTSTKGMSEDSELPIDGVFVEMGYIAKTDFVKNLVHINKNNEIVVDKYCATSQQGIFAAGDVTDVPYKQAVISAGQGSIAALSAYNYLQKLKGKPIIKSDWRSNLPEKK